MNLPDDVLDDVLRRVPPRHLAACRRVCKNWRAVIDGRGLVLAYLTPRPPRGIFINFFNKSVPSFFSRNAPTSPSIGSTLRFLPDWWMSDNSRVLDHSNGLLLYEDDNSMYVCNPVTRRWAAVPPPCIGFDRPRVYLVSDPTVSLHYHVLYFLDEPELPSQIRKILGKRASSGKLHTSMDIENLPPSLKANYEHEVNNVVGLTEEWPPYSYTVQVFSSRTGQWEERNFIREGHAVGTVSDMWSDQCAPSIWGDLRCYAVYLQGVFYLHCHGGFLIRLSLLEEKYLTIKTPRLNTFFRQPRSRTNACDKYIIRSCGHLRKSEHGVYYTVVHGYKLLVWVLCEASETRRTLEWELKHQVDLELSFQRHYNQSLGGDGIGKSWILDPCEEESNDRDHGWDSSDDNVIDVGKGWINKEGCIKCYYGMDLLGYHPYKEIVFLGSHYNGFAYYLGSSKLESLGSLHSNYLRHFHYVAPTLESFIYTPCMDDLLPAHHDL